MKALRFIKENLFAVGALCGALIAAIISFALSSPKKVVSLLLENKKESNNAAVETQKKNVESVKEFQALEDKILEEARKKQEQLTWEQEVILEKRKQQYMSAKTPEEKKKVIEDIEKNFSGLNFVPLDSIAKVEKKDD